MDLSIRVNHVFLPHDGAPFDLPCRVIWLAPDTDTLVLISLEKIPKQPWLFGLAAFIQLLRELKVSRTELKVPEFMMALEDEIPAKHKTMRDENWERIRPLLAEPCDTSIFQPRGMGALIQSHAQRIGVERRTIYRLLYRYWMFGAIRNALLPQYANSGAKGKERTFSGPRGRPPRVYGTEEPHRAKSLTEEDKSIIRIGYALYRDSKVKTITDAYTRTLRRYYTEAIATPDFPEPEPLLKPLHELPTQRQFDYWGKKAFDEICVLRSRKGERKWAKDHRALRGRAGDGVMGPCHRFEIDATIADIYLVSRYNANWIIGRPVVYVVIDVFSRMIVGLYVGLEGPGWEGARQALLNAFSDKSAFCASQGISIGHDDWPCAHLPQELCADRGEMLGLAAESIVSGLGITLAIAPPYRPDWKAVVESRFRLLNQLSQIHWTPGGVAERIRERGDRDYRLDATLDLGEFTQIMIKSVLHHNHHREQPDLLNPDMIKSGIAPTPIAMWNWGIDHGFGAPNEQARELVHLHLMARSSGTVQAGGLYFEGMYYVCAAGNEEARYSRARAKGREKVDVWYHPTDPATVWLRGADKSLTRYVLRNTEERYLGRRLEEIQDMLLLTRNKPPERKYSALVSKVQLDAHIQATIASAAAGKRDSDIPSTKSARLAGIRQNRAAERITERLRAAETERRQESSPAPMPALVSTKQTAESFGERSGEVISILSRLGRKDND
jgi:hypothetical protein